MEASVFYLLKANVTNWVVKLSTIEISNGDNKKVHFCETRASLSLIFVEEKSIANITSSDA